MARPPDVTAADWSERARWSEKHAQKEKKKQRKNPQQNNNARWAVGLVYRARSFSPPPPLLPPPIRSGSAAPWTAPATATSGPCLRLVCSAPSRPKRRGQSAPSLSFSLSLILYSLILSPSPSLFLYPPVFSPLTGLLHFLLLCNYSLIFWSIVNEY